MEEACPDYDCSVYFEDNVLQKFELETPRLASNQRSWKKAQAMLCGTKIEFLVGKHLEGFSVQGADFGLATDYRKRSFVIRIRVEGHQILLAVSSLPKCLEWIKQLDYAIAISLPLDERTEPRVPKIHENHSSTPPTALSHQIKRVWREKFRRASKSQIWLRPLQGAFEDPSHPKGWHVLHHPCPYSAGVSRVQHSGRIAGTTFTCRTSNPVMASSSSLSESNDCESNTKSPFNSRHEVDEALFQIHELGSPERRVPRLLYNSRWKRDTYYQSGNWVKFNQPIKYSSANRPQRSDWPYNCRSL